MADRLVTIPNVEIAHTGTYLLASGERTFTAKHFAAAVAAQDDPGLNPSRLKPGHVDPRFNTEMVRAALAAQGLAPELVDAASSAIASLSLDAEPAMGVVANMRLTNAGHTIVGDFVGMPAWCDDGVLASAFPSRSLEGRFNVTSSTGRQHAFVIDAVALLGTVLPGIATIDDIKQRFEGPPEAITEEETVTATTAVMASVSVDEVYEAYYDTLPQGSWWWVREVRMNPNAIIVDDGNNELYLVPFTIAADDSVSFGDPSQVRVQYVDASDSEQVAASVGTGLVKVFASRTETRPDRSDQEEPMDPKVLEALGLGEDATAEQMLAAITELKAKETAPAGDSVDPEDKVVEPAADDLKPETAVVDAPTLEALKVAASRGNEAFETLRTREREDIVSAAMGAGKFGPASRDGWITRLERDFEGGKADIATLASGLVPVAEAGTSGGTDGQDEKATIDLVLASYGNSNVKGA